MCVYHTSSTTHMAGHLRRHHKNMDLSVKPTPVTQTALPSSSGINLTRNSTQLLQMQLQCALGVFIAADIQPSLVVENSLRNHTTKSQVERISQHR